MLYSGCPMPKTIQDFGLVLCRAVLQVEMKQQIVGRSCGSAVRSQVRRRTTGRELWSL